MKKIVASTALAFAGMVMALHASAAGLTQTGNFNVNISTTSGCVISSAPTDVSFSYTAFATSDVTATPGAFKIKCSDTLPYSLALDGTGTSGTYSYTDVTTALAYTLTLSATSATGSGVDQTYGITGLMVKDQGGKCSVAAGGACDNSAASATDKKRTLTITY